MRKIPLKLLITGHSRTGTAYMAALCNSYGLNMEHEAIGDDGCSNWQFAVGTDFVPFPGYPEIGPWPGRNCYEFEHIVHVVRDPIKAVTSISTRDQGMSFDFKERFIPYTYSYGVNDPQYKKDKLPINPLGKAVESYLGWNLLIEKQTSTRVKVEDSDSVMPSLLRLMGFKTYSEPTFVPEKDLNTQKTANNYIPRTVDEIRDACYDDLWLAFKTMAGAYGYEL